jgi:hypothetical protein
LLFNVTLVLSNFVNQKDIKKVGKHILYISKLFCYNSKSFNTKK